ncbi:protein induced by osmotic stress [Scheffersomyces coipomensis]|uniref:protein induced by osmotic stress n=1 Tax=Scheffersomyces coipomensis TaxID=1788519 RepID=UPI00315D68C7
MTSETVFVTGATGYIAGHIILQLLNKGYKVVGQVRSVSKGEILAKEVNNANFSYEVVEVLEKEGAFDEVLLKHPEVTLFMHTASPVQFSQVDHEKNTLIPAINGTKNVLASIHKVAPQIKRVIVTSSVVAAATFAELADPNFIGGEDSWSSITYEQAKTNDASTAYAGSKKFAEQAAWEFVKQQKPTFKLTTVLPSYVFGPQAFEFGVKDLNHSSEFLVGALKLTKDSKIPAAESICVDVRDVANAHVKALESNEAAGKRIVVSNSRFVYGQFVDIIRRNFPNYTKQLPFVETLPSDYFANYNRFGDSESRRILDIEYIDFEKTIIDHITQVLAFQFIQVY